MTEMQLDLIGLEVSQAKNLLKEKGADNFKFVYYVDKKQKRSDRDIVVAVRQGDGALELIVCPMQFAVTE